MEGPELESKLKSAGWPWPLAKATVDSFDYAIGLRDGSIIRFQSARHDGHDDWVTIEKDGLEISKAGDSLRGAASPSLGDFNFDRGLVVRVSEIIWATDAPHGS